MTKWANVVEEKNGRYRLLASMSPPRAKVFAQIWTGQAHPPSRLETGLYRYEDLGVAVIYGYRNTCACCPGWDPPVVSLFSVYDNPQWLADYLIEDGGWYALGEDDVRFDRAKLAGLRRRGGSR